MGQYWRRNTETPIYYSAFCRFYDLVEHLVKKHPEDGANVMGCRHDYSLAAPLRRGHIRVAELLFRYGADVSIQGTGKQVPLHIAVGWPNDMAVGVVQFLLRHRADVGARDQDDNIPVHLASYGIDLELVRILLDHGANVSAEENRGQTPLHQVLGDKTYYSFEILFRVARLLTERGADVNKTDKDHEFPLHLASRFLFLDVA